MRSKNVDKWFRKIGNWSLKALRNCSGLAGSADRPGNRLREASVVRCPMQGLREQSHSGVADVKVEVKRDPSSGSWLTVRDHGRPEIIAYADEGSSGDDPVTVFWGGTASADYVMKFFLETVGNAGIERPGVFRTVVFTEASDPEEARREFKDNHELVFPQPIRSTARFVRFEHCRARGDDAKDADYIVWARLDEKDADTDDSIGVYVHPSRLQSIRTALAHFISSTGFDRLNIEATLGMLGELDKRLLNLR